MKTAAILYSILILIVTIFQFGLALGMPWGEFAMGGKFPGKFPVKLRVLSLVQIVILAFMSLIVLINANLLLIQFYNASETAIWIVVFLSGLTALMNLITPSKKERTLWAPVSILLLLTSLIVALN